MHLYNKISSILSLAIGTIIFLVAFSIVFGFFLVSYHNIAGTLEAEVEAHSEYISGVISEFPTIWEYQQIKFDGYLSRGASRGRLDEDRRILNMNNKVIAEHIAGLPRPVLMRESELFDSGRIVGRVEISRSLRPVIKQTGMLGLFVLPLSLVVFIIIHKLPLQALSRAEMSLQASENKYRRLFHSTNDAAYIWELDGLGAPVRLVEANDMAVSMTGYEREELLTKVPEALCHPDSVPVLRRALQEMRHKERTIFEIVCLTSDGIHIPVEVSAHKFLMGEGPVVLFVVRDITERKRAEQSMIKTKEMLEVLVKERTSELAESETKLRTLFESANDAIFILDVRGNFIDVNRAAHERLGYSKAELIAKHISEIDTPDFAAKAAGRIDQIKKYGFAVFEAAHVRKDGTVMPVEVNARAVDMKGETVMFSVVRDITERKAAEEKIIQSLHEKDVLLKEVHHRVKNNLQVIVSMLRLQSDYFRDADARALFRECMQRIETMSLIHEKLYRSKNLASIDFRDYANELMSNLVSVFARTSPSIETEVEVEEILLDVNVSIPCALIINELVSNVFKHAFPEGRQGRLEVRMHHEGEGIVLIVRDNGIGMPDGFDFETASTLGVQLVYSLVAQLNGTIRLDKGEGTCFRIEFNL